MSEVVIKVGMPSIGDILNLVEDKNYWADVTIKDVMQYYLSIEKYILPHLKDKVQSLKRDEFAKDNGPLETISNVRGPWKSWVRTEIIYSASSDETKPCIVCNDIETLLYLNTIGCIELNPWLSKYYVIERPDFLVIDLEPSAGNSFDDVIEAALVVKSILEEARAKYYIKTSGATGLQIYIGVGAQYEYAEVRKVAEKIAELTVMKVPEKLTIERRPGLRPKNKVYLDFTQNKRGGTLTTVYGLRTMRTPNVSMPLLWSEVKTGLHPDQFTIYNALERIQKHGDIFYPVLSDRTDLRDLSRRLDYIK
jgi:bifunctional non-homologous end joining protein LigD